MATVWLQADIAKADRVPDLLRLTITGGPAQGQIIDHPPRLTTMLTVGRTKASRVHIKDPAVSEKHGEFRWNGAGWVLRDLGSSNGTKVNGSVLSTDGALCTNTSGRHVQPHALAESLHG